MQLDDIPVIRQRNRGDRGNRGNAENPDYSNEINRQNELKTSQDSSQSRSRSRTRSRSKTSKSTGKDSDERKRKSKSRSRSRTRARTETETRPSSRSRSPTVETPEEKKDTDPYLSSAGIRQSNYQGQTNADDVKQSSKRGRQRKSNGQGKGKGNGKGNGKCNGHHADKDVEELSDDELHLIRNNNALAILYDFVSMIAGSDRRHYRKCGCVGKMPISHLWIVSDRDPMWTRRKKGINVLNFEESWSSFLTGAAQSAINSALHMIRQCKNPDTDKIPIVLLMSHKDLKSPFQNLVTCILQGSNDPRNSQSVSREAIVGIFDIEAYYFAWFGTAKVKNETIAGEERRTWYIP